MERKSFRSRKARRTSSKSQILIFFLAFLVDNAMLNLFLLSFYYMLADHIRTIENRPKPGIAFKDITPLLQNACALQECAQQFFVHYQGKKLTAVVGIESRGFIFGAMLAEML